MKPIDYMEALTNGRVPIPKNLNIRVIQQEAESMNFHYMFMNYAQRRAADWKARGFVETLADWPTLNARSKFWGDDQRAAFKNWEEVDNMLNPLGERARDRGARPASRTSAARGDESHLREPP